MVVCDYFPSFYSQKAWQITYLSFRHLFFSSSFRICEHDLRKQFNVQKWIFLPSIIDFIWPRHTCMSAMPTQSSILTAFSVPNHSFSSHELNVSFSPRNNLVNLMFPNGSKVGEGLYFALSAPPISGRAYCAPCF